MQIISMKQLREHFEPIREGLENGESYLLMYRSKPLGTLLPYEQDPMTRSVLVPSKKSEPIQPAQPASASPRPINLTTTEVELPKPPANSLKRFGLKHMLSPR